MRKLSFSSQADEELVAIAVHIAKESGYPEQGIKTADALRSRCEWIADFPGKPGRLRSEIRDDLYGFPDGNHLIFYRYVESPQKNRIISAIETSI